MTKILRFCRKNFNGSATVEFLLFGLPLFALLMSVNLNVFIKSSEIKDSLNLARQLTRIFVNSESDSLGYLRVSQAFQLGYKQANPKSLFSYQIECEKNPCLTRSAWVRINIFNQEKKLLASAVAYVDLWRNEN